MEENKIIERLDALITITQERAAAEKEFEQRLLEEFRALNRALNSIRSRETVGDL